VASITWAHTGNGQWDKASNWSGGAVPQAGDVVTLPTEGATYNVTIGAAVNAVAGSVTVDSGATLTVNGTLATTIDMAGGTLAGSGSIGASQIDGFGLVTLSTVDGAVTDTASGGLLEFKKAVDATTAGTFDISSTGTLAFDNAVGVSGGANPTVNFVGTGGTLDLSGEGRGGSAGAEIAQFNATVSGFWAGDEIVVKGPVSTGGDTVSFSGGVLTVKHNNTVEETIKLSGNYTGQNFSISYNSATATDTITVTCFMPGTLIATPHGEVAVEKLRRGDLVTTSTGQNVPITWLGRQTVSTRFADPLRVLPIRIAAGALADNLPARDLLLSPDHAILLDGVLVQAGALVNGTTIVRETAVPETFTYYHVEAEDHALILAENTPAETFIDNVDRLNFDNWAEHEALYPQGKPLNEMALPRAKAIRQVPQRIRQRLAERALQLAKKASSAA
jgi:hypothetical protein